MPYPSIYDDNLVPFSTVKKMWLDASGGLEPDETDPDLHNELIEQIASELGVDYMKVADVVMDWGSGGQPRLSAPVHESKNFFFNSSKNQFNLKRDHACQQMKS